MGNLDFSGCGALVSVDKLVKRIELQALNLDAQFKLRR